MKKLIVSVSTLLLALFVAVPVFANEMEVQSPDKMEQPIISEGLGDKPDLDKKIKDVVEANPGQETYEIFDESISPRMWFVHSWSGQVSGTNRGYSTFQTKQEDTQEYYVTFKYATGGNSLVLVTNLLNSDGYARGACKVAAQSANSGWSTATKNYAYQMMFVRENSWDSYEYCEGTWSPF
ncbi:hypothetical protein [Eubacterium sp. 1001713B170207_170306_E7]|uniref:hypothetical protein n=1 Tax=Eubacterium sp. 1001713B170207_170306_E7 TaxID=2787097 RepID=UPI00189B35B5|nr:hypothetical protein [Eubacterium sp. 1001713B170207_170306_E7]